MSLSSEKRLQLSLVILGLLAAVALEPVQAQQQTGQNFINEGKNLPGYRDPNSRFVVLNNGIANIAAQKFALPKETYTSNLAGMTVFPYYQASAPLKEFLNNATIGGMPVTQVPVTPHLPTFSLPPTDLIRMNIPIPNQRNDFRSSNKVLIRDQRPKDEIPWMVAHQGGQAFGLPGDNEALALLNAGTMFSASMPRTMILRCGTMWVMTGSRPAAVLTRFGAVCVRPYSIACVEQTWTNKVRAMDLYGQPLELQLSWQGKSGQIIVERGKQLIFSDSTIASAGSADYIEPGKTDIPGVKVVKAIPDLNTAAKNIEASDSALNGLKALMPPFNNPRMESDFKRMLATFGITDDIRREEIRKQTLQKYNIASRTAVQKGVARFDEQGSAIPSQDSGPLAFPHPQEELEMQSLRQGVAKYLSGAELATEQGRATLNSGEAIFVANKQLIVRCHDCSVFMREGSIVHTVARKDLVVIRNIKEESPGSVKVKVGPRVLEVAVGGELIVGTNAPAVFAEMKTDGVARRNLRSTEITGANLFMNKSEVDLTSLMQYSPIMRKLYKSKDSYDKELRTELMKTIVALNMVTAGHGRYQRMAGLPGVH